MKWPIVVVLAAFCIGLSQAYDQLVSHSDGDARAEINTGKHHGSWDCHCTELRCSSEISPSMVHNRRVNVTLRGDGLHTCNYYKHGNAVDEVVILVKKIDSLPLAQVSGSLVSSLLLLHYKYLSLAHRFYATDNYYPNIAKYFNENRENTMKILDQVVTYVLAKQVTTSALDGFNPPNYLKELFTKGFHENFDVSVESTTSLADAFSVAFQKEGDLLRDITNIGLVAQELGDTQLEEFLYADIMPQFTKNMKILSDHKNTVEEVASDEPGLGQFIFDRMLS